jgi:hypothetical protein
MNYFQYNFEFERQLTLYARKVFLRSNDPLTSFGLLPKQIPDDILLSTNSELTQKGLPPVQFIHFWRKPSNHHQPIHVDPWDWDVIAGRTTDIVPTHVAINIPLTENASTEMFWYDGSFRLVPKIFMVQSKKVQVFDIDWQSDHVVCDKLHVNDTYILRVSKPHNVILGNKTRDLISIRLKNNPTFEHIVGALRK